MAKTAMVQPPAEKPDKHLLLIVEMFSQGRAYTLISKHKHTYKIMFEGDYEPSVFKIVNNEPVLEGGDPE